ncbi:MAG: T9SS type A sorting domain-containing protein [Pedobacter sp.]|nr:MAG: T9SS type A sorting domain-containing protein [Pedobacter sp.]
MKKRSLFLLILFCIAGQLYGQSFVKNFTSAGSFVKLNNAFFFAASNESSGIELWKSDGTTEGTVMLKDINPGFNSANVQNIIAYNGKIYFSATDVVNGQELWVSDGTAAGTVMLKDINPNRTGTGNSGSSPRQFTICNGILYFFCNLNNYDSSLWKTDGTAAGTVKVFGGENVGLNQLRTVANKLYFNGGSYNGNLYSSDGTTAGTKLLQIDDYGSTDLITVINNDLVFATKYSSGQKWRLYKLNPANDSFVLFKSFEPPVYGNITVTNLTAVGNNMFFSAQVDNGSSVYTDELWKSDGTAAGTIMLKSFPWLRHQSNSVMQNFVAFNGKLCFASSTDYYLWTSDGTVAGTAQAANVKLEPSKTPLVVGSKIYFNNTSSQLWSYDGTTAKSEFTNPSNADQLFEFNNNLFFTVAKPTVPNKVDLWNNSAGTMLTVKNVNTSLLNKGVFNISSKANDINNLLITVSNTGTKDLNLAEISVVGAPFYVTGQPKKNIPPGTQTTFNLLYAPVIEEIVKGKLIIKSDDNENGVFSTTLSAIATGKTTPAVIYSGSALAKNITFAEDIPDFTLSNNRIDENITAGYAIGTFNFTNTIGTVYTFANGGDGNGNFKIENNQLKALRSFDFELKSIYSVSVIASTPSGNSFQKNFIIQVNDIQEIVTSQCLTAAELLTYSLNDVAYTSTKLIAVGTGGKIIVSENDGKDWRIVPSNVTSSLNQIKMFEQVGYITNDNLLLKTENGGDTWFELEKPDIAYPYLSRMYFYSANVGFLFGENKLYKTTNGGKSWKKLTMPSSSNLQYAMSFINETTGFIAGASKSFFTTTNGGDTWQAVNLPTSISSNTNFLTLNFTSSSVGYLSDQNGNIYQSTDAGLSWNKISTTLPAAKITFINANTAYLVNTYYDNIYKTIDAGLTWTKEANVLSGPQIKAFAANATGDKLCAVGWGNTYNDYSSHAIFLKSGSNAWEKRSWVSYTKVATTNWIDDKIGYIFGTNSFKTIDGGITWKQMNLTLDFSYGVSTSFFVSKDLGFCGAYPSLYKTTDGGETWNKVTIALTTSVFDIHFMDAQNGVISSGNVIFRTTNGGTTWQQVHTAIVISSPSFQFLNAQVGYAYGIGSGFSKTIDGGATWTNVFYPSSISVPIAVHFFDEQNGLLGATDGQLYKTTNGGATWTEIRTQLQLNSYSFSFLDRYHGYLISTFYYSALIYETFDGGETWTQIYNAGVDVRKLRVVGDNAYAVGGDGAIFKFTSKKEAPTINYIVGDRIVARGESAIYKLPVVSGVSYTWKAEGASQTNYQNSSAEIIWKQPGIYTIEAYGQNGCATGAKYILQVTVQDVAEPVIIGPAQVMSYSKDIEYVATLHPNSTYLWTVTGSASMVPDGNKVKVTWGNAGVANISVVEIFNDFNLMKTATLGVTITSLATNNFSVSTTSVTCKGSNNGSITVKSNATNYSYSALVTGPNNFSNVYSFSTLKEIQNLAGGTYTVCISIVGNPSFQACYTVNVNEPKDLSVYANVKTDQQRVSLTLGGASQYYIDVNGVVYQTTSQNFEVRLPSLVNIIKISSNLTCQGVIEKKISLAGVNIYPNPVVDWMKIDLGILNSKSVTVKISDLSGKLLYNKTESGTEGYLQIDLRRYNAGMYVVQIITADQKQAYKILKQ